MKKLILTSLVLTVACGDKSDDEDTGTVAEDTANTFVGGGVFEDFINVTEEPIGNIDCFTGSLGTETPAENCIAQRSMAGQVLDFQEDDPVDEAQVEFFWADAIFGAPDEVVTADANGNFNETLISIMLSRKTIKYSKKSY